MFVQLTGSQKRHLRGLAHALDPVIQIGHKGIGDSLMKELDEALDAHELIKVKLGRHAPIDAREAAEEIARTTGGAIAQIIGRVIVVYREAKDPEDRRIRLPTVREPSNSSDDEA